MPKPTEPFGVPTIGTPRTPQATRVMLLGSGELGKEVLIALQRLGVELLDARLVDVAAIGVGDLGLIRTGRQVLAGDQVLDQGL
ncbi:MAG: hypothetical protein ACLGII_14035, partial [Gammaproteobacteria bacterium]